MSNPPERIYIPGDTHTVDILRALRAWIEQHVAKEGKTLDPAWYRDGPEDRPERYPELRKPSSEAIPDASPEKGGPT